MTDTPPTDIAILFARDPLQMSDEDFSHIIQKFRNDRTNFIQAPAKTEPKGKVKTLDNLGDLEIEI